MMATRYLWVDVSRLQVSAVILAVEDDDDPLFRRHGLSLLRAVRPFLAAAVAETLEEYDWQTQEGFEAIDVREIGEREARQYICYVVAPVRRAAAPEQGALTLESGEDAADA